MGKKTRRAQRKKRNGVLRYVARVRSFNSRLKPPFRQIFHGALYLLCTVIALLLLALAFVPGIQIFIARTLNAAFAFVATPAFMVTWLPVRLARKLVTFSVSVVVKRTEMYRALKEKVTHKVLLPEDHPGESLAENPKENKELDV
jgi:hypothetical protein